MKPALTASFGSSAPSSTSGNISSNLAIPKPQMTSANAWADPKRSPARSGSFNVATNSGINSGNSGSPNFSTNEPKARAAVSLVAGTGSTIATSNSSTNWLR